MYTTKASGPPWPGHLRSIFNRKGGHWPPSAFLEDSHDERHQWLWPRADRSGPG